MAGSQTPVSYTHLDVYKRQQKYLRMDFDSIRDQYSNDLAGSMELASISTYRKDIFGVYVLDVYKRQGPPQPLPPGQGQIPRQSPGSWT